MKKWLKRIRGAVGMGLTWAVAWGCAGAILRIVAGVITGGPIAAASGSLVAGLALASAVFGVMGFIGGTAFSVVLGIAERRRTFDEMSLPRFASWGTLGGLLLLMPFVLIGWAPVTLETAAIIGVLALLGGGCASGSLALARRADDRELLEDGADVADIGLTEEETHELLGT